MCFVSLGTDIKALCSAEMAVTRVNTNVSITSVCFQRFSFVIVAKLLHIRLILRRKRCYI